MGQYYIAVNIEKGEYADPHDYGATGTLMESAYVGGFFIESIAHSLVTGKHWNNAKIVWAGKYMAKMAFLESYDLAPVMKYIMKREKEEQFQEELSQIEKGNAISLYDYARMFFTKLSPPDGRYFTTGYIVNKTKEQYVRTNCCPVHGASRIHPLPLLTASGNGRGDGDYNGPDEELVGTWAGDPLQILLSINAIPVHYKEIIPQFEKI